MFTVGRGWKGWFVERVSDAGVVSPGSPGGSRHFLRSCWIFLTTVVTLSCVASVCFTYFVKWANTTATNFLVALIYILTNAFCLWSIGCNRLSSSHWLCYCGGGQPQRWIWNDLKNERRFRKGRDVGFKSDTFKRRICQVSMGGHQCAVLLLLYTVHNVTTCWFLFGKTDSFETWRKEHHWVLPPHTVVSHYSPLGISKVFAFTDVYHCLPYFPYRFCSTLLEC